MKLEDILEEADLTWKQKVAAGLLAASTTLPFMYKAHNYHPVDDISGRQRLERRVDPLAHVSPRVKQLVTQISSDYKIGVSQALNIVKLAHKYEQPDFPRAADILAVIGVESSFNPKAVSNLKDDPALGLMQVRPGSWGLSPEDLKHPEDQIKHGAEVLAKYYDKLKSKKGALQAYNLGITNYKNGHRARHYVQKYNAELNKYIAFNK